MKCNNCGSTNIVSDRSLGGRQACSACGSTNIVIGYNPFESSKRKNTDESETKGTLKDASILLKYFLAFFAFIFFVIYTRTPEDQNTRKTPQSNLNLLSNDLKKNYETNEKMKAIDQSNLKKTCEQYKSKVHFKNPG